MKKHNTFVLFLMTEKGLRVLQTIIEHNRLTNIECVVIGKDKNVQNDFSQNMVSLCEQNDISFTFDREKKGFDATFYLCVGWRWLIRTSTDKTIVVFHESLLPKYRGFAPLVNQLINKEDTVGVTALVATESFDEGPVIDQIQIKIEHPIRIQEAIEKITPLYQKLAIEITAKIINAVPIPKNDQDHAEATYSLWRDEKDYCIDWSQSAEDILRHIYAVGYPYSGASSTLNQKSIRITDAEVLEDVHFENRTPGKVFKLKDGKPIVVCGTGLLKIEKAIYEENQKSVLPLNKLRSRFE